jgi:hypothetical protein
MRVVAQKYEFSVVDDGVTWTLYDTVEGAATYAAVQADEPNYLEALLSKWGFEPADFEVQGCWELVPDWEALGYSSEGSMLADRAERARRRLLSEALGLSAKLEAPRGTPPGGGEA